MEVEEGTRMGLEVKGIMIVKWRYSEWRCAGRGLGRKYESMGLFLWPDSGQRFQRCTGAKGITP